MHPVPPPDATPAPSGRRDAAPGAEGATLPEEYWLLTTGTQQLAGPTHAARLGLAMAVLVELERRGELRWQGTPADPVLDPVGDCRCPDPLRARHARLVADFDGLPRPARFALDPLLADAWAETARHLTRTGAAVRSGGLRRPRFRVADVDAVRDRRSALLRLLPGAGTPADVPRRELDLLVVAAASDSTSDMFRLPGLELPDAQSRAVERVTASSPLRRRLEAAAGYSRGFFPGP